MPWANSSAPPSPISLTSLAVVSASNIISGALPLSWYVPFAMWMTIGRPMALSDRAHCSIFCSCCEQTPPSVHSTWRGVAGGGGDGGELGGACGGGGGLGGDGGDGGGGVGGGGVGGGGEGDGGGGEGDMHPLHWRTSWSCW